MADQKIQVVLKCKETIQYYQIKEMTLSEFKELKKFDGADLSDNEEGYYLIRDLIDPHDVFDTDGEFTSIEIYKEKKKGEKRK